MTEQIDVVPIEQEAVSLKGELEVAYEGLKTAASHYAGVLGKINDFLDRNEVIPVPEEGLDDGVNDLVQLWNRSPDTPEIERVLKLRLTK